MAQPRVSVLLPVYNAERYLAEALDSVLGQTLTDFELLAHDDGSTDRSPDILQDYASRDSRIRLSRAENAGVAATLNRLIEAARAPYLARIDGDDICLPDRFERQVAWLEAHPDHAVVGGWTMAMDGAGRIIAPGVWPADHDDIDAANLAGRMSLVHPAAMMRKTMIDAAGRYDPTLATAEDLDLWLRVAEIGKLANLRRVVLKYRVHPHSLSGTRLDEQAQDTRMVCERACARRGITVPFEYQPWRMKDTRASRRDFYIGYGWDAWNWGNRDTWRHYALKSVTTDPLSFRAWKLLVVGALRRPAPGRNVLQPDP